MLSMFPVYKLRQVYAIQQNSQGLLFTEINGRSAIYTSVIYIMIVIRFDFKFQDFLDITTQQNQVTVMDIKIFKKLSK